MIISNSRFPLENANSSGQGQFPGVKKTAFYAICIEYGYKYSHSVNIGTPDGKWQLYHCFKHFKDENHSIGFYDGSSVMYTKCYTWNAKQHYTPFHEIEKHLTYKSKKYKLPKMVEYK